ncbi:DUF1501 domain-containing protein [Gimesia fumaroli]|uniref:Sulfatase n=1 Tax=Gimesia fumaroli TaxID=2527976 RepID=A0A518IJR6_9PLAN|nr:DUF1501 domain-containing protein [Gimesia fumaroli]QDV53336.1 hypothetical protein Enr17x_54100 [Gimesia fumaroli]
MPVLPSHNSLMSEISRRSFFDRMTDGLYGVALTSLIGQQSLRAAEKQPFHPAPIPENLAPKRPHFAPRATSVIHLCMQGGPSQVDLFDPKPALKKFHGKTAPRELTGNAVFEKDRTGKLMQSPFEFKQHGKAGAWVSDALPHLAQEVDEMTIVRSMYNVHPNHEPAIYKMQSGQTFPGHPVFGSWITYGLGNENQNLPAYVVLADPSNRLPTNNVDNWMSGYLSPLYQGTRMKATGSPLLNLAPDYASVDQVARTKQDLLKQLDRLHQKQRPGQMELEARIQNYEMAANMQLEATETLDISQETPETLAMYGIDEKETDSFGRRCLLARRLVENGVRFVQLYTRGQIWDNHSNINKSLRTACGQTDLPIAGLLKDLRQRGLLDNTLVLWGGEFGRLPTAQITSAAKMNVAGRDHGPYGFSAWMAGGGVKRGLVYGNTDEVGYASVENRVSIQDWHATILHLLGMDHEKLVYERNGLGERLTHQFPTRVVHDIIA